MTDELRLQALFFKTQAGPEPVRDWLKSLPQEEKKIIGQDIKTVQFSWPLGMSLVRKLDIISLTMLVRSQEILKELSRACDTPPTPAPPQVGNENSCQWSVISLTNYC